MKRLAWGVALAVQVVVSVGLWRGWAPVQDHGWMLLLVSVGGQILLACQWPRVREVRAE